MSDDTDVEQLLENFQNALDTLNKVGDVESLISKLDAKNNRKLLKKVKNVVSDVHSRVNTIKEKVSKAYKKVKIRCNSETDNENVNKDGSDKETDSVEHSGNLEDIINSSGRYSPVLTGRGRKSKKPQNDIENTEKQSEIITDDSESLPVVSTTEKSIEDNVQINRDQDADSSKNKADDRNIETETPNNLDDTDKSNKSDDQDKEGDDSIQEIIEATPKKPAKIKLSLSLRKNQNKNDKEFSTTEILDTTEELNQEESGETDAEEKEKEKTARESSKTKNKKNKNSDESEEDKESEQLGDEVETSKNTETSDSEGESVSEKSDMLKLNPVAAAKGKELKILTPKIKLVDINKLLAPDVKPLELTPTPTKSRKSVTFDNSVIVLTSSDEETPKKNPKEKGPSPLKSALRKGSSKTIDLSDSDSKENNENLRNTRNSHRNQRKKLSSDHSSEGSDSDENHRSRRLRDHDKIVKERFSKLIKERGEKKSMRKPDNDSPDEKSRKENRRSKRNRDKKLESDNSDAEDKDAKHKTATHTKKRRKKELLQESSLSDASDNAESSDSEVRKASKGRSRSKRLKTGDIEPDVNDSKFKLKVLIELPKFKCEELPELYKRKKEIFEIKKLTKMNFPRRTRGKRDASKTSDEPDKAEKKKITLTLKLNKRKEEEKEENSDDDRPSTEDNAADGRTAGDEETNGDSDVDMAEAIALDVPDDAGQNGTAMEQLALTCLDQVDGNSDKEENNKTASEEDSDENEKTKKKTRKKNNDSDPKDAKAKESDTSDKEGGEPRLNGKLTDSDEENENKQRKKRKTKNDDCDDSDESGSSNKKEKNKKAAAAVIESSDSDEDFSKFSKKKDKSKGEMVREAKKRMKKKVISDSDSDDDDDDRSAKKKSNKSDEDSSGEDKTSESSDSEKDQDNQDDESKPARRRIKRVKDSSSDDEDKSTRKQIRRMIDRDSLSETTKKAEQDEKDRKARIVEKQRKYNQIFELKADAIVDKVVLDFDEKTDKPLLSVHKKLVKQLKPHQVHGVKFMWDACFESLERTKTDSGSGCILAHCMGLGKTLQVIALSHALLTNQEKTKVEKIMVVCPLNTVLNWKNEFRKWMPNSDDFEIYELVSIKTTSINHERNYIVKCWHEGGGILIIGYNMYRNLSNPDNKAISKKLRQSFQTGLVDPGPDLVVCDEGHLLKNEKTNLSIAMNRIKTLRRIVLTGTPLQNNLREYWCMVQFIKPNLLGTYKEYLNRFVNPITNGQYTDSTQHDIMVMRRRSHVLHKLLDGVVQRQDYAVLEPYLPPKYEYVLFLKLTEVQRKLYQHYMDNFARRGDGSNRTSFLFTDFQELQRICTHPRVLLDKSLENKEKKLEDDDTESEGSLKDFIDDDESGAGTSSSESSDSDNSNKGSGSDESVKSDGKKTKKKKASKSSPRKTRLTRAQAAQKRKNGEVISESEDEVIVTGPKQWWEEYITKEELGNIDHSAKIFLLFQILKECEEIGDKILVFSQSLYTLNCIEYFLAEIDEATQKGETDKVGGYTGSWTLGLDYFRLDGSSSCDNRASWCDHFNDPENIRARLFLISTKAGGLGINLVAANRVIIFDVSWNPSHDIQSIYRVYRFGQTKPSYIYRFVTYGAMEMKIYERQVTKQAISKRVIDEQQIDRHYSQNDIQELYKTDLDPTERPIPLVPKDVLLGEMLQKHDGTIYKYHEHQSLLENKHDEQLNEDERKAAWEEFENEKVLRKTTVNNVGGVHLGAIHNNAFNFSPQIIQLALGNIVRKDNPTWSDVQIKGILPALVTQLQVQMSENDFSMYNRVQQEIQLMQALQAQRMRENFLKEYQMQQLLQRQQLTNQMLGNMNISPEDILRMQLAQQQGVVSRAQQGINAPGRSSDIIELND